MITRHNFVRAMLAVLLIGIFVLPTPATAVNMTTNTLDATSLHEIMPNPAIVHITTASNEATMLHEQQFGQTVYQQRITRPATDILTLESTTDHEPDPRSAVNPYIEHLAR